MLRKTDVLPTSNGNAISPYHEDCHAFAMMLQHQTTNGGVKMSKSFNIGNGDNANNHIVSSVCPTAVPVSFPPLALAPPRINV